MSNFIRSQFRPRQKPRPLNTTNLNQTVKSLTQNSYIDNTIVKLLGITEKQNNLHTPESMSLFNELFQLLISNHTSNAFPKMANIVNDPKINRDAILIFYIDLLGLTEEKPDSWIMPIVQKLKKLISANWDDCFLVSRPQLTSARFERILKGQWACDAMNPRFETQKDPSFSRNSESSIPSYHCDLADPTSFVVMDKESKKVLREVEIDKETKEITIIKSRVHNIDLPDKLFDMSSLDTNELNFPSEYTRKMSDILKEEKQKQLESKLIHIHRLNQVIAQAHVQGVEIPDSLKETRDKLESDYRSLFDERYADTIKDIKQRVNDRKFSDMQWVKNEHPIGNRYGVSPIFSAKSYADLIKPQLTNEAAQQAIDEFNRIEANRLKGEPSETKALLPSRNSYHWPIIDGVIRMDNNLPPIGATIEMTEYTKTDGSKWVEAIITEENQENPLPSRVSSSFPPTQTLATTQPSTSEVKPSESSASADNNDTSATHKE